jgi:hypothetical protein
VSILNGDLDHLSTQRAIAVVQELDFDDIPKDDIYRIFATATQRRDLRIPGFGHYLHTIRSHRDYLSQRQIGENLERVKTDPRPNSESRKIERAVNRYYRKLTGNQLMARD